MTALLHPSSILAVSYLSSPTRHSIISFTIVSFFKAFNLWLDETHGFRLRRLGWAKPRFQLFNAALRNALEARYSEVPPEAEYICGYVDTTRFAISRPSVRFLRHT